MGVGESSALCDVAVILGCAGLWWGSSLLISSQAVSSLAAGLFWSIDIAWRLVMGRFLVGGTSTCGIHVYRLGAAPFELSHRSSHGAALGHAENRIRPPRSGVAGSNRGGLFVASRFLPSGFNMNYVYQDPLFHRSWGPAPVHLAVIFCWSSRACLLADPSSLELDVSGGKRCENEVTRQGHQERQKMGTDAEKNREKYLAMLKTAVEEARIGLRKEEFPSEQRYSNIMENCWEAATTAECRRAILPRTAKPMRFERRAGNAVTATKSW